jgi:hypothetical protein
LGADGRNEGGVGGAPRFVIFIITLLHLASSGMFI